ncbi:hypothetical protein NUACC21_51600 [Scytonema sp. NUACC21]
MTSIVKRILICDDIAEHSYLLQAFLQTDNWEIEVAGSGPAVLAKIETDSNPPDLLILDVMMPEMDGYEVVRHIRRLDKFQSLPILLVTGLDENYLKKSCNVKVDGFIQKPIDANAVIARVQAILNQGEDNEIGESFNRN